ncbi:MAG: hypothetical protein NTX00_04165 [Candidatus Parcubacteria bacterium]|nr:hypothetical protein [Candidatus Parcubacteria bacterium]
MDLNKIFQTKSFRIFILVIGCIIIALLIFRLGIFVGYKKANFTYGWGENYHRNFGGPKGGFFGDFKDGEYLDAHGVSGQIIKIDGSTLIIKGKDNTEKNVQINENTMIRSLNNTIQAVDLKVNDFIVIIGDANNEGQVVAKFIRVLPPPPAGGPVPPIQPDIKVNANNNINSNLNLNK